MNLYGVDIGYGYVKGVSDLGRRVVFPSVVKQAPEGGALSEVFGKSQLDYRLRIVNGETDQTVLVGDAALAGDPVRSWDSRASARRDYETLLLTALAAMGAQGAVRVALGMPLSLFADKAERQQMKMRLTGLTAWVALNNAEEPVMIDIAAVSVYPQAVGAYLAAVGSALDSHGLAGKPVGLVDIGFRTTDYLLLSAVHGKIVPEEQLSGSLDQGVGLAFRQAAAMVSKEHGLGFVLPSTVLEEAFAGDGEIVVGGQTISATGYVERALKALGKEIGDQIKGLWASRLDRVSAVLVVGGGGRAVCPFLDLGISNVSVWSDPVYANALGFLALARDQEAAVVKAQRA